MNIRKFTGATSRDALRLVREALGADAVVLSNRTRAEVSAEVEQARKDGTLAYLRKANSYPQGLELAQGPYRSMPESNQLAGGGR